MVQRESDKQVVGPHQLPPLLLPLSFPLHTLFVYVSCFTTVKSTGGKGFQKPKGKPHGKSGTHSGGNGNHLSI